MSSEAGRSTRPRHLGLHFVGAGVAKIAPPLVQFLLLLLVARAGSLDEVGLLALGSAVSFLCGSLAELGLGTSLSIPRRTFGTDDPPLRATRGMRVGSALAGSVLYVLLWLAGLGGHDPALLLVSPLPFALALGYGYAGAMNASARLHYEIPISIGESAVILALALAGSIAIPALTASLGALTIGRGLGTAARMMVVRGMPQSPARQVPRAIRAQLPFALATAGWVVQGQADMVAIGFVGALALAAIYGPLVRTAYTTLLSAEALSWSLFGGAHPEEHHSTTLLIRHWRATMMVLGVAAAIAFVALAEPLLHLLLDRQLPDLTPAVILLGLAIVTRFGALTAHVAIIRAGRQRSEVPVLMASAVVVGVGGGIAAGAGSLTGLAAVRLGSEVLIGAAFLVLRHRLPRPTPAGLVPTGERIRILVLSPFPPHLDGSHGGSRVIAQRVTRLAQRAEIAVLSLRSPSEASGDERVRRRAALVEEVARPAVSSLGERTFRFIKSRLGLMLGRPLWVSDLRVRAYRERLKDLGVRFHPHVIQVEYGAMAQYLPALRSLPAARILVEHDPEAGGARGRGIVVDWLDALAWRRFRKRVMDDVDAAVVFTERDRALLGEAARETPIVRIPLGTDVVERTAAAGGENGAVLFVGNFRHPPNVDAARRLVRSIFPRVRDQHPNSVLYIVGDDPPSDLQDASPQVVVTGHVHEVAPYIDRAAVVVAPMRHGGGMRVKVLEALAAGKALVASPLAAEGLDVEDCRQLLLATTDEEFAARICDLLADERARRELAERARAWAARNLTWSASIDAYERLYAEILADHQATKPVPDMPIPDASARPVASSP